MEKTYSINTKLNKKYSLFVGRWQCIPPHAGHIALIETALKEGKNVWIAIRNTKKDEKNPYSCSERGRALRKALSKWPRKQILITRIPDVEEIVYGRRVGYGIREIHLSEDLEKISGTKIREAQKEKELWQ